MNDQPMTKPVFDRTLEDLGNVVELGHVNVTVPDQRLATLFYVSGLGLTRDPYLMTSIDNMWINVGRAQFHLPLRPPQVVRGTTGLVLPDLEALMRRLHGVQKHLGDTKFSFRETNDAVETTCPWGNRIRCHAPDAERFSPIVLGMPYVEFGVPAGALKGIVKFYRKILGAIAGIGKDRDGEHAWAVIGDGNKLIFRESDEEQPPFDGHHVQIALVDFSGPHKRLLERGLITEESDQHQYRFQDIIDLDSGKVLFTVEHEVRSMRHPMYARPLVNRSATINNRNYMPGHEAARWAMEPT
jgi:catechol 2,3-dioxygenase-like lactoylglutathione lyase family enzyme